MSERTTGKTWGRRMLALALLLSLVPAPVLASFLLDGSCCGGRPCPMSGEGKSCCSVQPAPDPADLSPARPHLERPGDCGLPPGEAAVSAPRPRAELSTGTPAASGGALPRRSTPLRR